MAGKRQIPNMRYGLQHNIGLGGAAVVTLYKKAALPADPKWQDPVQRFGYNPAVEARGVTPDMIRKVISAKGSLLGTKTQWKESVQEKVEAMAKL
jgi:sterol carrier protein 2